MDHCHSEHLCTVSGSYVLLRVGMVQVSVIGHCAGYVEVVDKLQVFSCGNSNVKQLQFGTDGSVVKLITSTVSC